MAERMELVAVRMPRSLVDHVDALRFEGETRAAFIRTAVREYVMQEEAKP